MENKELREFLKQTKAEDVLKVYFLAGKTYEFVVRSTKTGKGYGGTPILLVEEIITNKSGEIMPSHLQNALKLERRDAQTGNLTTLVSDDLSLKKNKTNGKALKEALLPLLNDTKHLVSLVSNSVEKFNGEFEVCNAVLCQGRYGQIATTLKNKKTGSLVELWSHRHSGVVEKVWLTKLNQAKDVLTQNDFQQSLPHEQALDDQVPHALQSA